MSRRRYVIVVDGGDVSEERRFHKIAIGWKGEKGRKPLPCNSWKAPSPPVAAAEGDE
jgi:hypothetical protein